MLDIPMRLYIITDTVITATYGSPCAKYRVGIHAHGSGLDGVNGIHTNGDKLLNGIVDGSAGVVDDLETVVVSLLSMVE